MIKSAQKPLFQTDWVVPVETFFYSEGFRVIAGVDEVGRGALAGPVVTAAVILNPADAIAGIRDSKQLTSLQRERLAVEIRNRSLAWSVDLIGNEEVDRLNVLQATRVSMRSSLGKLAIRPDLVLIDAVVLDVLDIPAKSLIKGDELSANIGAASIVAKVYRDEWMRKMGQVYPDYGFEKNKGYGTRQHLSALEKSGICPLHRRTFRPITGLA